MEPLKFEPLFPAPESTIEPYKERLAKEKELYDAAKGFETMLVTNMVKSGFKTAREISASDDEKPNQFMDMAYDQLAKHMGENMNLGLAEMIYNSMKDRV